MASIRPYKIEIPAAGLEDLKRRLDLTRLPEELDDAEWEYGAPLTDVKRLTDYWKSGFDWRSQEAKLNELSHFRTQISVDGFSDIDLHFVHEKSNVKGAIPLLFVHGWPGSFYEATKLLPLLANPKDGEPSFHIVAPSLPNFGFSSRVTKKGFGLAQHAEVVNKLMLALGYDEYVTQGGDYGFFITRALGHLYPENVKAIHTNWVFAAMPSVWSPVHFATSILKFVGQAQGLKAITPTSLTYTEQEMKNFAQAKDWFEGSGRGYFAILSTKPMTVSYGLEDSPSGLLGFIWEKLHDWSDDYKWTDDEVLTWISIYWFSTAGPGASGILYKEVMSELKAGGSLPLTRLQSPVKMPLGLSYFPKEVANMPKSWTSTMGNVVYVGEYDKGGHFAAWERPDAIAKDLKTMFGKGGGAFGVVKGLDGY